VKQVAQHSLAGLELTTAGAFSSALDRNLEIVIRRKPRSQKSSYNPCERSLSSSDSTTA